MFGEGQRLEAVKLFKKTGSLAVTIRILGYPKNDSRLRNWINEFKKTGIYEKLDVVDLKLYSQEEIDFACEYYDECKDLVKAFTDLGYPSDISILHRWISPRDKSAIRKQRAASHIYSLKKREDIIREFFSSGLSQNEFARQLGLASSSVSVWKRQVP